MLAPEGFSTIFAVAIVLILVSVLTWKKPKWYSFVILGVFIMLLGLVTYFFRDPEITLPDKSAIVSPCTGTVIEVYDNPDGGTHLSMFLSVFDIHAIRMTGSGRIISAKHYPGKFHPAYAPEAGKENEHVRIELDTPDGIIVTRVLAGLVARRIICYLNEDDIVQSGQRVGFIRFGSRAELDFPPGFECNAKVGDKLKGGITSLGNFSKEVPVE